MAIISDSQQALARLTDSGQGWRMPDFRNLGVVLRLLLLVNLLLLAVVLVRTESVAGFALDWAELAARVEPALLLFLLLVYGAQARLRRVSAMPAMAWLAAAALAGSLTTAWMISDLVSPAWLSTVAWTLVLWGGGLWYFHLHDRALAPALAEARLMALTARIRPHFFFNCLNGVLGIMREDPRRAEHALEEMADLFRALMRENRDLVSLSDEIALARQYLDLERLRLGERLKVTWDMATCPPDALVPPLMLQPLLENAVRHGIEVLTEPGEIHISFVRQGDTVLIAIVNPLAAVADARVGGNHMALENIRERLMLFFDLEAQLTTHEAEGCYRVLIRLPYRRGNEWTRPSL